MNRTPHSLDAARRQWLADLETAYRRAPTADTALGFARGCWMCGEYDAAIEAFRDAAQSAPERAEHQLAIHQPILEVLSKRERSRMIRCGSASRA